MSSEKNRIMELDISVREWIKKNQYDTPMPCQTFEDFIQLGYPCANLLVAKVPRIVLNLIKNFDQCVQLIRRPDYMMAYQLFEIVPEFLSKHIKSCEQFIKLLEIEKNHFPLISSVLILKDYSYLFTTAEQWSQLLQVNSQVAHKLIKAIPAQQVKNVIKNFEQWIEWIQSNQELSLELAEKDPLFFSRLIGNYEQFLKLVETEKKNVFLISIHLSMNDAQHIASFFTKADQLIQLFQTNFMVARRIMEHSPDLFSSLFKADDFIALAKIDQELAFKVYCYKQEEVKKLFQEGNKRDELHKWAPRVAIGLPPTSKHSNNVSELSENLPTPINPSLNPGGSFQHSLLENPSSNNLMNEYSALIIEQKKTKDVFEKIEHVLTKQIKAFRWNLLSVFFRSYDKKREALQDLHAKLQAAKGSNKTVDEVLAHWKTSEIDNLLKTHRNRFFSAQRPKVKTETETLIQEITSHYRNCKL